MLTPSLVTFVKRSFEKPNLTHQFDQLYKKYSWYENYNIEKSKLKPEYQDFIGWRRASFEGNSINININGYRKTVQPKTNDLKEKKSHHVLFFGGSTVWGTGSSDEHTIPSIFVKKSNIKSYNLGESGYISRQNLSLLINIYQTNQFPGKKVIIFYGGYNDVTARCMKIVRLLETTEANKIRKYVNYSRYDPLSLNYLIQPWLEGISKFKNKIYSDKHKNLLDHFECHKNKNKVDIISHSFLTNWKIAQEITKSYGDIFIPVLQPVANFSNSDTSHLTNVRDLSSQFEIIYNKIINNIDEYEIRNFLDLTKTFDFKKNIYIDDAHVTPSGNEIVAEAIYNHYKTIK